MKLKFNVQPIAVKEGLFEFGNVESRYDCNSQYFTYDGEATLPISGEIHYSRYNNADWEKEILKMKALGVQVIASYVFWNYHEVEKGKFDFSGDKNVKAFLSLCKKHSMPCLLRIGPWAHGEVMHGGFPKWINSMPGKRSDAPLYLEEVRKYFVALYAQIKDFMDGETLFGVQLENEYTGKIGHIRTLRKMAIEIGYKVPFFTMTMWPTNTPDKNLLPLLGGYPDAPWDVSRQKLKPNARFAITPIRTEVTIGEDLFTTDKISEDLFADYPYIGCEVGPGNQVTQHRRPIIAGDSGYGVGFGKFASGMNLMGYYMFHGGRNPNYRMLQESRRTLYPNNYPIIDYDFQSPISRYGKSRLHGKMLKNMHLFINTFDKEIAAKPAYFPNIMPINKTAIDIPYTSIRTNTKLNGYFFVNTYDKQLDFKDIPDVSAVVTNGVDTVELPNMLIPANSMFFYPFNLVIGNKVADYITAQPLTITRNSGVTTYYFAECKGIKPSIKIDGKITMLPLDVCSYSSTDDNGNINKVVVLNYAKALNTYNIDGRLVESEGTVYSDGKNIYSELQDGESLIIDGVLAQKAEIKENCGVVLSSTNKTSLPYNHYLFSHGKRYYYEVKIDTSILKQFDDVEITFDFKGLNLQVFSGTQIIDDYFNTDGKYIMRLKEFKSYLDKSNTFTIKAVPSNHFGVARVYNEIGIKPGELELTLNCVKPIIVAKA